VRADSVSARILCADVLVVTVLGETLSVGGVTCLAGIAIRVGASARCVVIANTSNALSASGVAGRCGARCDVICLAASVHGVTERGVAASCGGACHCGLDTSTLRLDALSGVASVVSASDGS